MAAVQAQQYARRSTMVSLSVPPTIPPLSIDDTFAALTRNFIAAWARMITGERDTITSGRFQVEVLARTDRVGADGEPIWELQHVYISLPAGQNPLPRQRDEAGLAESLNVLKHNLDAHLSDGRFEASGIIVQGVRTAELFVNPGPRLLARAAYDGQAWVDLPKELKDKRCCVNIQNKDNKCIQYCLIARQIQLRDGQLPANAHRPGHYQLGKLVGRKHSTQLVPIEWSRSPPSNRPTTSACTYSSGSSTTATGSWHAPTRCCCASRVGFMRERSSSSCGRNTTSSSLTSMLPRVDG